MNMCKNVISKCKPRHVGMAVSDKNNKVCTKYSGVSIQDKKWNFYSNLVTMLFPQGDVCNIATKERYQIELQIKCNAAEPYLKFTNQGTFDVNSCNNTITVESELACDTPARVYRSWWSMTPLNKYWLAGIIGIIGLIHLIIGFKIFKYIMPLIVALGGALFIRDLIRPIYVIHILIALGFGVGLSILIFFVETLVPVVLGGLIGYIAGTLLFTIVLVWFPTINATILYYVSLALCVVLAIVLLKVIENFINVIITAIIGAYMSVRAVSIFFGGFPDETYTSELIQHMEFGALVQIFGGRVVVYIIAMLATSVVGVIIQLGIRSSLTKDDDKEKESTETKSEVKTESHKD